MDYRWFSCFTRHYPLITPRKIFLDMLPQVPQNLDEFRAKDSIRYVAYISGTDYVVKSLFWFGIFEPWVVSTLQRLLRPGEIACDVGANVGDTALPLARVVGGDGRIFCFEPVPMLRDCLERNIQANRMHQITAVPIALSDQVGEIAMNVSLSDPGMSRIAPPDGTSATLVRRTTFDKWHSDTGIGQVSVCKIDVEGHELEVLRGMVGSLQNQLIRSFVFERHEDMNSDDPVFRVLNSHNFVIKRLVRLPTTIRYLDMDENCRFGRPTPDYVAVLRSSVHEQRLFGTEA